MTNDLEMTPQTIIDETAPLPIYQ